MITFEIIASDAPQYIGSWEYNWNKITIGGPKGLHFCSITHAPITLSIYKSKYILFESTHFYDSVLLNNRKVSFPFVAPIGSQIQTKFFTLIIKNFSESQYESLEDIYKKKSSEVNLNSPEANFIKKILEE